MAVYNCECGLIISTSSDRPLCLRCLRVLGPGDRADHADLAATLVTAVALAVADRPRRLGQALTGFPLGEGPVLPPLISPI